MIRKVLIILFSLCYIWQAWGASHHPEAFLNSIHGQKDEGKQIVGHFCATCHAEKPIINLGAPIVGKESDWKPRITHGVQELLSHVQDGYGAMPARGGCFECSDEQLQLAILAMLPKELRENLLSSLKLHN